MFSADGAGLADLGREQIRYVSPGRAETKCLFNKNEATWICDDGTKSSMVVAGLPFYGIARVEFDGRVFVRAAAR